MPHTYCTNLIHRVFSTKERANSIADNIREQLFAYLFGIAKNLQIEILALGGTENHIHILISVPAKESLSDIIRDLKANSSRWMSEMHYEFSWQQGFRRLQPQPFSGANGQTIYPQSGRAPREKEFRGGVPATPEEVRSSLRSAIRIRVVPLPTELGASPSLTQGLRPAGQTGRPFGALTAP